jgi:hypothetical protein
MWVSRYWSWQLAPFALLCAAILLDIVPLKTRKTAIIAALVTLLARIGSQAWVGENWRGAAAVVRDINEPIVLYTGFIEAEGAVEKLPAEASEYLSSPLLAYGVRAPVTVIGLTKPEEELVSVLSKPAYLVAIKSRRGEYRSPDRILDIAKRTGRHVSEIEMQGLVRVFKLE